MGHTKLFLVIILTTGKVPNLHCVRVSLEPTSSQLPSVQNNPYAKVAHPWETCSESLYYKSLNIPNMSPYFT